MGPFNPTHRLFEAFCPVKRAALEAPNQIAVIAEKNALTYRELDSIIEKAPILDSVKEPNSLSLIAKIYKALRCNTSLLLQNPKEPKSFRVKPLPFASLLTFTSGAAQEPKLAILPLQSLLASAQNVLSEVDFHPGDIWRLNLPLFHVAGLGILFRASLQKAAISLIEHPGITHLSCTPTHLYRASPISKNLRYILLGGAPPPNKLPSHLPIHTSYGLSEMCSTVAIDGKILPNTKVQITKEQEILVSGSSLFYGYLKKPPQKGWFDTGDLGAIKRGKLFVFGRKDRMFISGGENIHPEEIEKALEQIDGVIKAFVKAKDDPEFGQRPIAFIQSRGPQKPQELLAKLRDFLPKFKLPDEIHFIAKFPETPLGKIDRKNWKTQSFL